MSKKPTPRKINSNEAKAVLNSLRVSPRKLNLVAGLIRNLKVEDALIQLTFSKRRIAKDVKKCLKSAIANAENNHNLNIDSLYISQAIVGKSMVMKRMRARARGRAGRIEKFFSNISITVCENKENV
ncbi:MAG: 50S ribosomal protein L22 [Alphaproteobacteria bacterium]